jgi:hypothetical protein
VQHAGRILGVPDEQLMMHDVSKFSREQFPGYALHYHGGGAPDAFAASFLRHWHVEPHHWQHWMYPAGYNVKDSKMQHGCLAIPYCYLLEMVADWQGASRVYTDSWDISQWLMKNIPHIWVHPETAKELRRILGDLGYSDLITDLRFASESATGQ